MNISTELLLCGGLLAGLTLAGFATVRLLSKRLEKADSEDFPLDIPGPDDAGESGPSLKEVQAVIDELTRLATAPVTLPPEKAPSGQPPVARVARPHKSISSTQRYAPSLELAFRLVRAFRRPFGGVFQFKV